MNNIILESIVDVNTGEILSEKKKSKKKVKEGWYMSFQEADSLLSEKILAKKLAPTDIGIFFFLRGKIKFGNHVDITQTETAKILGFDFSRVNKSFKKLINEGLITQVKDNHNVKTYMVSSDYLWKGSMESMESLERQRGKKIKELIN